MNKVLFNAKIYSGIEGQEPYIATLFLKETMAEGPLAPYSAYEVVRIIPQVFNKLVYFFSDRNDSHFQEITDIARQEFQDFEFYDAHGASACPEFLDFHEHSEFYSYNCPSLDAKRRQHIRGSVVGNCGISVYPVVKGRESVLMDSVLSTLGVWPEEDGKKVMWKDLDGFKTVLKNRGVSNRLYFLTGHAALRIAAMEGNPNRPATDKEIDRMCGYLKDMIDQGSIGFSTGLYYAPCLFASEKELLSLLKVVSSTSTLFAIHIREEGNRVVESIDEAISLAQKASCRLQISHLKAVGERNQIKVPIMLYQIEKAHKNGLDVMFDQYPYTYGSTSLFSLLPPSALALTKDELMTNMKDKKWREATKYEMENSNGFESIAELCTFDNIFIQALGNTKEYDGMSISSIAKSLGKDPYDAFFDILLSSSSLAVMKDTTTNIDSLKQIYTHPLSIFASDSLYAGDNWHERSTNCVFESLSLDVKFRPKTSLYSSIARMTGRGSTRIGEQKYFTIAPGSVINLVNPVTMAPYFDSFVPSKQ